MTYAFDPQFDEIMPLLPTISNLSTLEVVQAIRAGEGELGGSAEMWGGVDQRPDVRREDRKIPGPEGAPDVSVRIYRPAESPAAPMPALVQIHGGGFILGNLGMSDGFCDRVAAEDEAVVVSVDYRLAPEDPFPAGVEDCYAALSWLHDNADDLGVDRDRIAISGQSAGGGLAAGTALMARDRGGPAICFQLLEIPELDDRLETPSMQQFTDTPLWNRPNAVSSWKHYLGADDDGHVSSYAAPSRAEDLSGLPSAFVSVMEFDPLRDEGIIYAMRLLGAGVATELHAYPGTFHGSAFIQEADVSRRAVRDATAALTRAFTL